MRRLPSRRELVFFETDAFPRKELMAMPKRSETYNLLVLRPDLAREWHPTKNGGLGPRDVTPGSGRKVWWLCGKGHWWLAAVRDRVRGMQCTYCRELKKQDDPRLVDAKPELLREWHPTRNPSLKARDASLSHPDKVWWICDQGHEWEATIRFRLAGKGCPICGNLVPSGSLPKAPRAERRAPVVRDGPPGATRLPWATFRETPASPLSGNELRKGRRYERPAIVMIEKPHSGIVGYAELNNFSAGGMMLRSDFSLAPGEIITVKLDKPLHSLVSTRMTGKVIWCQNMEGQGEDASAFGIGLCLI
jgi:hypothetical protein